ncbi:MAG: homocysteine S-methyltransferase family protein [Sphingomonadaceae bacterium]|nr:homocysteine S-methyltransferase family protein [Sphingomonadaceae bacterium]
MSARETFLAEAAKRILIFDGAFGTQIQDRKLSEEDFAGELALGHDQKGNNDILALTRQDVIADVTRAYFNAGSDLVSTNTFSANRISQADYGAEGLVREINIAAARIAREVADEFAAKDGRPRFVAGAIGPTNKTLSLSPDVEDPGFREIDFDFLAEVYREQAAALLEGGADFILVETIFDTLNAKAAVHAVLQLQEELGRDIPIMLSMTLTDLSGRNLSGHTVEAFWYSVRHAKPLTVGLNCSFGADQLRPHIQLLSRIADCPILAYPNAGLPNELGEYDELPETTARHLQDWAQNGTVNALGGCCGSTPEHIAAIAKAVAGLAPRTLPHPPVATRLAGLEPFTMAA